MSDIINHDNQTISCKTTECFRDLYLTMTQNRDDFLVTFEERYIFRGSWGVSKNWLYPKSNRQMKLSLSKSLIHIIGTVRYGGLVLG